MSASDPHPADRRGRRIRIALDPAYGGAPALALAADLGRALQARIEAVFLESEDLLALARLPLAREITAATRLPRALDTAGLERDLQAMATAMRRRVERMLGEAGLSGIFRVARGDPALALAQELRPGDLVLLPRPEPGLGRAGAAIVRIRDMALAAGADVLVVCPPPPGRPRRAGRIVLAAGAGSEARILAERLAVVSAASLMELEDAGQSLRQIIDEARRLAASIVIVGGGAAAHGDRDAAEAVLTGRFACSVLFVGTGAAPGATAPGRRDDG